MRPLRLNDSDGNLRELSQTEQGYIAHLTGVQFVADSDVVGYLTLDSTGASVVGTFTNNYYDKSIGGHPASNVIETTTLYENLSLAVDSSGADYRLPIRWEDSDDTIHELNNANIDSDADAILSNLFTNERPGTFRLASAPPSGDYAEFITDVFTDTRGNNDSSTVYNIYRRTTQTAPAAQRPMSIKRSGGRTGTYEGVQEQTDAQISYSYSKRCQQRIKESLIGTHQLRTNVEGAPTDPGTWAARGTALDTRHTLSEINYTRVSQQVFGGNFTSIFTGDFTGNYVGNVAYSGNYQRNSTAIFSLFYTGDYNVTTDFTRVSQVNFTRNSTPDFTRVSSPNFTRVSEIPFTRFSQQSFQQNFSPIYVGNSQVGFAQAVDYTRISTQFFNIFPDYTRVSGATFTGTVDYTRFSTRVSQANFTRESLVQFNGPRTSVGDVDFTAGYSDILNEIFYVGNYIGELSFQGTKNYTVSYIGDFIGNFVGDFLGNFLNPNVNFTGDFLGNYIGVIQFQGNFTGNYIGTVFYAGDFIGNFAGPDYTGDFLSPAYVGNYVGIEYTGDYLGADYTGNYLGATYTGNYTADYTGNFLLFQDFQRVSQLDYTGDFIGDYTGAYVSAVDFVLNSTTDFTGDFNVAYTGDYTGDYLGLTVDPGFETITTYTLYCKVAA